MRSAVWVVASLLVTSSAFAAPRPRWISGPTAIAGTSKARNPEVAIGGGVVHVVYRVRGGGLGAIVGKVGGTFSAEKLLPGTMSSAASTGPFNYPVVAVDDTGIGSYAWAPPSAETSRGLWFARVGSDGAIVEAPRSISDRWVETLTLASLDDGAHVMATAIKTPTDLASAEGVFDFVIAKAGGAPKELRLHSFGNAKELASARSGAGIALIGRLTVMRRWDYAAGTWSTLTNSDFPTADGVTSIGRPKIAFDAATEVWSTIGWVGAKPTHVLFKQGGSKSTTWTKVSTSTMLDPPTADGEPAPCLAVNAIGERAVAWLADTAPRLRIAIGGTALGAEAPLSGSDDASSFAMAAEGSAFRVVFVDGAGTLQTGLIENADDTPSDAGADVGTDAPIVSDTAAPADAVADTSIPIGIGPPLPAESGCSCRTCSNTLDDGIPALVLFGMLAAWRRRAQSLRGGTAR